MLFRSLGFSVVEAGTFQMFVVNGKTQRLDKMKYSAGSSAQSCYTACIGGDFRLDKNDIEGFLASHRGRISTSEEKNLLQKPDVVCSGKGNVFHLDYQEIFGRYEVLPQ